MDGRCRRRSSSNRQLPWCKGQARREVKCPGVAVHRKCQRRPQPQRSARPCRHPSPKGRRSSKVRADRVLHRWGRGKCSREPARHRPCPGRRNPGETRPDSPFLNPRCNPPREPGLRSDNRCRARAASPCRLRHWRSPVNRVRPDRSGGGMRNPESDSRCRARAASPCRHRHPQFRASLLRRAPSPPDREHRLRVNRPLRLRAPHRQAQTRTWLSGRLRGSDSRDLRRHPPKWPRRRGRRHHHERCVRLRPRLRHARCVRLRPRRRHKRCVPAPPPPQRCVPRRRLRHTRCVRLRPPPPPHAMRPAAPPPPPHAMRPAAPPPPPQAMRPAAPPPPPQAMRPAAPRRLRHERCVRLRPRHLRHKRCVPLRLRLRPSGDASGAAAAPEDDRERRRARRECISPTANARSKK